MHAAHILRSNPMIDASVTWMVAPGNGGLKDGMHLILLATSRPLMEAAIQPGFNRFRVTAANSFACFFV